MSLRDGPYRYERNLDEGVASIQDSRMAAYLGDLELPLLHLDNDRSRMGVPAGVESASELALDDSEPDCVCVDDDRGGRVPDAHAYREGCQDDAEERDRFLRSKSSH